ncbi:MAG: DinB family protein [Proteobacteria bacterium]|nr:DinB family protein [Pseudomonadota bacterium]
MNTNIAKTIEGLDYFSSLQSKFDLAKQPISTWSIAEHIDHSLKVHNNILNAIKEGKNDENYIPLKLIGRVVLLTNFIPRGKAKTPEKVAPDKKDNSRLLTDLADTKSTFNNFDAKDLEKQMFINHPVFGSLNPQQWIRFLYIHQYHHLKIIREILK